MSQAIGNALPWCAFWIFLAVVIGTNNLASDCPEPEKPDLPEITCPHGTSAYYRGYTAGGYEYKCVKVTYNNG